MSAYHDLPGAGPGGSGDGRQTAAMPGTAAVPGVVPVRQRREFLFFALRDKRILIGAAIVLFFVALAIVGPMIDPTDPQAFVGPTGQGPSSDYWFGTTTFGQDVFAQFASGAKGAAGR